MLKELPVEIKAESKSHTELEVSVRNHTLTVDEPETFGGNNKGPNPLEYLFVGLAGCFNVTIHQVAKEKGLKVDSLKIDIKGNLDIERFMNKDSTKRAGFQTIEVEIDVMPKYGAEIEQQILQEAEVRCPVSDTIQQGCIIKINKK